MPCRQGLVAVLACLAVFVPTSAGLAAQSLGPPSGTPDPRQMVLVAADLGGAKVTHQGYYKDRDFPSTISYSREFDAGRYQGTPLLYVDSEAEMGTSAESTSQYLLTIRRALSTKQGRALFLRSFESSFPKGGLVSKSQVGRPRTIPLGAGAFDLPITFRLLGLRTEVHLTAFAVERALGSLVTIGVPGSRVPVSRLVSLGKI